MKYRTAEITDIPIIRNFVDYWLSGRGFYKGVPGSSNDYFVSQRQHEDYLKYKKVHLAFDNDRLVGWAVLQKNGSLIHLLVDGNYRGRGIGSSLVKILNPERVRSKYDQSTGNPEGFYKKLGYVKVGETRRIGKNKNIDLLYKQKKGVYRGDKPNTALHEGHIKPSRTQPKQLKTLKKDEK